MSNATLIPVLTSRILISTMVMIPPISVIATPASSSGKCTRSLSSTRTLALETEKKPDPQVVQDRNASDVAFSKKMTAETSAYLDKKPELRKKITARAAELSAKNAPLITNYYGVSFKIDSGNLVQIGTSGTADRILVSAADLPKGSSIVSYQLSPDQSKLTYGYSVAGSDWSTWSVINMKDLSRVEDSFYIKFTGGDEPRWNSDSSGFFYLNWTTANRDAVGDHKPVVKFHKLGTDRSSDPVLFDDGEYATKYSFRELSNGHLVVYRSLGAEIPLAAYLLKKTGPQQYGVPEALVVPNADFGSVLGVQGSKIIIRSSSLGSNYGLYSIDTSVQVSSSYKTTVLVKADTQKILSTTQMIGDRLILQYLNQNLEVSVEVRDLDGQLLSHFKPSDLGFPDWGQMGAPTGDLNSQSATYFTFSSVTMPTETFKVELSTGVISHVPGKPVNFDGTKVKSQLINYTSADGTSVPMWVYTRNDTTQPPSFAYLWSYGAIGTNNVPYWGKKFQLMLELGMK